MRFLFTNYLLICFSLILGACGTSTSKKVSKGALLAQVKEQKLYESDIEGIFFPEQSQADSNALRERYVNQWLRKQLFLQEARERVNLDSLDIEQEVENYRMELIAHAFEKAYLDQKLDSEIKAPEMSRFYEKNKATFQLSGPIVKGFYVSIPASAPRKEELKAWLNSNKPEDYPKIKEYCVKFAQQYQLNDDNWVNLSEFLGGSPFRQEEDLSKFLIKNRVFEKLEDEAICYLSILDFIPEGEDAPLEFVEEAIETMIINRRKVNALKDLEQSIYEEAQAKKKFKVFKK